MEPMVGRLLGTLRIPNCGPSSYHCPTWLDYLRQRSRATQSERALDRQATAFHIGPNPVRVRPFGSIRWKDDAPDRATDENVESKRPNQVRRKSCGAKKRRLVCMGVLL
ncbi:MFS transporter [Bradyrhizobium sp. STM 3562]|uniref:MFS transporter n=1 Tax=Bradyrhizobium sp. STM 3562 TaxID=578924 RepID=UPI00389073EF